MEKFNQIKSIFLFLAMYHSLGDLTWIPNLGKEVLNKMHKDFPSCNSNYLSEGSL